MQSRKPQKTPATQPAHHAATAIHATPRPLLASLTLDASAPKLGLSSPSAAQQPKPWKPCCMRTCHAGAYSRARDAALRNGRAGPKHTGLARRTLLPRATQGGLPVGQQLVN